MWAMADPAKLEVQVYVTILDGAVLFEVAPTSPYGVTFALPMPEATNA